MTCTNVPESTTANRRPEIQVHYTALTWKNTVSIKFLEIEISMSLDSEN
jgi:hypothetical protein